LDEAVQALYDVDIRPPSGEWPLFVERSSETYEQWVTIETPAARLRWEDPSDAGYAFHRSLAALNHFLVAFSTAYNLPGVHEVSTREIGMVMLVGALEPNAQWRVVRYVWMHPDGWEAPQPMKSLAEVEARMGLALTVVGSRPPYLPMKMWHNRAVRAAKDGDSATQVMVLQIAAESMVFATYLMTLVDGHKTGEQVQQEADRFRTFESLVNTQMPRRLGGDWDKRQTETPFGQYWRDVYTMRNKVVHQGYVPHAGEGEAAEAGFRALSRHIRDRLMENQRKYPRTILARLEDPTFYGYTMTRWLESKLSEIREEPAHLFWLPDDVAGRD
jgi:uncharacterized membrane protein